MSVYIIPVLLIALFIYSNFKKVNTYSAFVDGAKSSLNLIFDIFAYIVAIFVVIELFSVSGLSVKLASVLSPVFNFLGVPVELTELIVVKPFSGSGGLALLKEVFDTYGVDSYISRCACVILGSSETVFYVSTVYFSKTSVKKLGFAIPIALLSMIVSIILGCALCRIM
ncbi:MAG: hypothetical protein KBT30_00270 [Clostridiales bacterium]|nr:hypothetical protein [Candidatus Apopatousia equi]